MGMGVRTLGFRGGRIALISLGVSCSSTPDAENASAERESPNSRPAESQRSDEVAGVAPETEEPVPGFLRVVLTEVLVAPVKADGRPWDMGDADTEEALKAIDKFASMTASSGDPVTMAVKAVTAALPALSKGSAWPDVEGEAMMSPVPQGDGRVALKAHAKDDPEAQLLDSSGREVGWIVQPEKRPVLRIRLLDRDALNDDAIGVFTVSSNDMVSAWRDGGKVWARVTEQTNNQVLAVGIIVENVQ